MDEKYARDVLNQTLRKYGVYPKTTTDGIRCTKCHTVITPKIGEPDVLLRHPTARSFYMEVKVLRAGETSFPFNRITPEQHKYLSWWTGECGGLGYLGLGCIRGWPAKRETLGSLYLIDWLDYADICADLSKYRKSIPFLVSSRTQPAEVRENNMDIINLLQPWALTKERKGWSLPKGHTANQK